MTLVVSSLVEGSIAGVSDSSKLAFRLGADIVECRLDHIPDLDRDLVAETRKAVLGPAIATLRSKAEGGLSRFGGAKREELLRAALESDFEYVDFEFGTDQAMLKRLDRSEYISHVIVSSHFSKPVKKEAVSRRLKEASELGDVAKVAMPCEHAADALMLAEVGMTFSRRKRKFVIIGMGQQGQLTRVFASRIGSFMAYACLPGRPAAPGQLDVAKQSALVKCRSTVLGLIGHPVSHSVSKPMQEAALERAGLTGAYLPLDFMPGTLTRKALLTARRLGLKGLNVTIPYKGKAFEICDRRQEYARATGAVNTISYRGSCIIGENTDVRGFAGLIEGKITITRDTKALIVGAGGAARAVAYVLSQRGARLTITDIERKRAERLAAEFGGMAIPLKKLWKSAEAFKIIVNCTPVGMKGVPGNPIKRELFKPGTVYFDIVYNPLATEAMSVAMGMDIKAYGGLEMLVQQGAESFRIWTGLEPDVEAMREAARRALT
jgi:shikimate dehydrogenase/3-dehydroquinate dehydratase type I